MSSSLFGRFRSVLPCIRGIIRKDCLYCLNKRGLSGESRRIFESKYYEDKYNEIRNRLTTIPHLDLLNKVENIFKHDLCHKNDERLEDFGKWNAKVFDYNARVTGLVVAGSFLKAYGTYGFSMDDSTWNQWDSDRWRSAAVMAWCIEMIPTYIIMIDDVVDKSVNRRKNLCWHKKPEVGLSAVHDALVLQQNTYKVLRKHFSGLKCYLNLLHEFNEVNRTVSFCQSLDTYNNGNLKSRFEKFTLEKYEAVTENGIINVVYLFPMHVAMHLTGVYSAKNSAFIKKICWKIGMFLQIQDDSFDFVLPIEYNGLKGIDIRRGKVTWFALKFLEEAPESMKKQFLEKYGIDDDDAVDTIIELYEKTNMIDRFHEFEEKVYTEISTLIESADDVKGALFYDYFHTVQARQEDIFKLLQTK